MITLNSKFREMKLSYILVRKKFEYILTDGPNENVKKYLKPEETFSEEVRKTIKHGDTVEVCPRGQRSFQRKSFSKILL